MQRMQDDRYADDGDAASAENKVSDNAATTFYIPLTKQLVKDALERTTENIDGNVTRNNMY